MVRRRLTRRAPKTVTRYVKATRTKVDGYTFDSKGEARRYGELKLLQAAEQIKWLKVHPKLDLTVNNKKIGRGYLVLDFTYIEKKDGAWRRVYEDFKAVDTRESKLRRQLAEAIHGIKIKVTQPWRR